MRTASRIIAWYGVLIIPMIVVLFAQVSWFSGTMAVVALVVISMIAHRRITAITEENRRLEERAAGLDQIKKHFISHVSHELKAPLASMQETTHLVLERIPGPLTEKQERLLQLNLQSGKRLATMIGNLLDLSRLEAGVVDYEMQLQDVGEIAQSVIVELGPQAIDKGLRFLTDIPSEPLISVCDPNRIVQILTNLLENAMRFSPRNGFVSLHMSAVKNPPPPASRLASSTNGYIMLAISDTGPGIEDPHKEGVFRTFHPVRQAKKSPGQSLGLGLAICRALVEAHNGAIWVEDNPTGGSVFFIVLPRAPEGTMTLPRAS
jgi:two-component system, NtrC family, sensor histidine kinase GlrK